MAKHRSEIFRLSDEYSHKLAEDDYISATWNHIHDNDHRWNDYSFHEVDPFFKNAKSYRKKIAAQCPIDYYDEVAQKVILSGIDDYIETANDNWQYTNWGSVFSEPEGIYNVFEHMPKETVNDISNIIKRMSKIPIALNEWADALIKTKEKGLVNAKLRVQYVIDILKNIGEKKLFLKFAMDIDPNNKKLIYAAHKADTAYIMMAGFLIDYKDKASDEYWVGEDRYIQLVKSQTGLTINPREVYEWGLHEVARINEEMWKVAAVIKPNAISLTDLADALNKDPKYQIEGKENFKKFLESITNMAIKNLHNKVFDIPKAARDCKVELDEVTIDESPYYLGPSDDLIRPAKTSYPTLGRNVFSTWENYSTWLHESVPGHHMQIITSYLNKDTLTAFQRNDAWNSGYGEGWALYSEKLMDELGYFEDPGYKMGYLLCQAMRAARLVVDIGLHLQYNSLVTDGKWTPEEAVQYMTDYALLNHSYAVSEVKRYISWAGQAITYKLGERVWLQAREDAKKRLGSKFNLKKFHMYALKLGPMGLDMLDSELAKWNGQ